MDPTHPQNRSIWPGWKLCSNIPDQSQRLVCYMRTPHENQCSHQSYGFSSAPPEEVELGEGRNKWDTRNHFNRCFVHESCNHYKKYYLNKVESKYNAAGYNIRLYSSINFFVIGALCMNPWDINSTGESIYF